jgi:aminoglycoside phosphotransferase (APT) family kinase protein
VDQPTTAQRGNACPHMYASASVRDLADWNFYVALSYFKLGVIREGITHRAVHGSYVGSGAIRAAGATPEFMPAGLRAIGKTSAAHR